MKQMHLLNISLNNETNNGIWIEEIKDLRNIYITSNEEIKEICWCIDIKENELKLYQVGSPNYEYKNYKKIIMSTDKSINMLCGCGKDCGAKESGIQPIDDKFLEILEQKIKQLENK